MKYYLKHTHLFAIFILASLLLFSCSSDDDGNGPGPDDNVALNQISVDISGSATGKRSGEASISTFNGKGDNTFEIGGSDGPDATFKIRFYTYNGGNDPVPWPEKGNC